MQAANPSAGAPTHPYDGHMIHSVRLVWRSSQVDERSGLPG
jgi:hypothetical protein